jgi:gamma-glutamylputrescine oxidase
MNLLYANDAMGKYPHSWYAATSDIDAVRAPLSGEVTADVCVIGAGYTGLSAALHLASAGRKVIVLEAQRVGFGASGRNGGQLGSGQRVEQRSLEQMMGVTSARYLWELGQEAKNLVKSLISKYQIECNLRPGIAWTAETKTDVDDLYRYAEHMQRNYNYHYDILSSNSFHEICPSPAYKGGIIDWDAGHLHPLRFAIGLAHATETAGGIIHERSAVLDVTEGNLTTICTEDGVITANHVIYACNGYLGGLKKSISSYVMPINNFIAATAPLGPDTVNVLTRDIAVSDSRFVVNYFRLSHDGRLLFGGGETYGYRFPTNIESTVRKPMCQIFPQLRDTAIDFVWGGTLAITMNRLPHIARVGLNALSASGYSGHGIGTATHAGKLMADAVIGESEGFDSMAAIPKISFPGGRALRSPLLALAMAWYGIRDRLSF